MKTFVVRVADLAGRTDPSDPVLRGVVEDVESGLRTPFLSGDELVATLTEATSPAPRPAPPRAVTRAPSP